MTTPNDWSKATSLGLAGLLQVEDEALWTARDLAAILAHQLAAPLETDLGRREAISPGRRDAPDVWPAIRTFGELFDHPSPPVELLERTKRFAKTARSQPDGPLPDEVATVLYLAAIATARRKCGRSISQLDEAALRHALEWALAQPWLAASLRELFVWACQTLADSQQDPYA